MKEDISPDTQNTILALAENVSRLRYDLITGEFTVLGHLEVQ